MGTKRDGRPRHETACLDCGKKSRSVSISGAVALAHRHANLFRHTVLTGELEFVEPDPAL